MRKILYLIIILSSVNIYSQKGNFYALNNASYKTGILFGIRIAPSAPIRYTDSTTVGGILCTGNSVGCTTSFSFAIGSPPINVSNNNILQSLLYPYAVTYFTNCGYIYGYFYAAATGTYTVSVDVLYKGVKKGSASYSYSLVNNGTIYTIAIPMYSQFNIENKSSLTLLYY